MSFLETLVILLVAVIVLGPKNLPAAARKMGHWMGVFRRASDEFKRQIMMMDQTVDQALNSATDELAPLVPTDEELGKAFDALPEGAPPPASPDDLWGQEPVSGGLPSDVAVTEPPSPPSSAKPEDGTRPEVHPTGAEAEPVRSLGLSPTRSGSGAGKGAAHGQA